MERSQSTHELLSHGAPHWTTRALAATRREERAGRLKERDSSAVARAQIGRGLGDEAVLKVLALAQTGPVQTIFGKAGAAWLRRDS